MTGKPTSTTLSGLGLPVVDPVVGQTDRDLQPIETFARFKRQCRFMRCSSMRESSAGRINLDAVLPRDNHNITKRGQNEKAAGRLHAAAGKVTIQKSKQYFTYSTNRHILD